jgi:hypothetical protein
MKKLIAAAVATSVSAIALADVSITGNLKANYVHTDYQSSTKNDSDVFSHEGNLSIKGKSGDTSVVMNFGAIDGTTNTTNVTGTVTSEDVYLTTKIGDVNVKMGTWDNGDNSLRSSARSSKVQMTTSLGGFDLGYLGGNGGTSSDSNQNDEVTVGTSLGGVNVSYTAKDGGETIKASTSLGGVNVSYLGLPSDTANADRSLIELSTELSGVGIKIGKAEAESSARITGDSWLGDYERSTSTTGDSASDAYDLSNGQDVTGIELSTSVAGNAVKFRNVNIDDVASQDTSFNKLIVTRPLASGAILEVVYTDLADDAQTATDAETLDIELQVKF